jgi:hypothetical protein
MPTNGQSYAATYVNSIESFWEQEKNDSRAILLTEEKNRKAYMESLERSIRAADDDIRAWTKMSGDMNRAERKLLLDKQRLAYRSRGRASKAASAVRSGFDKTRLKAAKATAGSSEEANSIARILSGLKSAGEDDQVRNIVRQLQQSGRLTSMLAGEMAGLTGRAGSASKLSVGMGAYDALKEANAQAKRSGLQGVDDRVLRKAAAQLAGTAPGGLNEKAYEATMKVVSNKAASSVRSRASEDPANVIADELQGAGFDLETFMPAIEAFGLISRRSDLQQRLEKERSEVVSDIEGEAEQRFLERVGDVDTGLEFGGGFLGSMRFAAQNKQKDAELDTRIAGIDAEEAQLGAMSSDQKLLLRASGRASQSFAKHGANIPPGVSPELWKLGSQIAQMNKSGGFSSKEEAVVKARALMNQMPFSKNLSPEQRENNLLQLMEFSTIQQMGDFPPMPEDAALPEDNPDMDVDENRAQNTKKVGGTRSRKRKGKPGDPAVAVVLPEGQPVTVANIKSGATGKFSLSDIESKAIARLSRARTGNWLGEFGFDRGGVYITTKDGKKFRPDSNAANMRSGNKENIDTHLAERKQQNLLLSGKLQKKFIEKYGREDGQLKFNKFIGELATESQRAKSNPANELKKHFSGGVGNLGRGSITGPKSTQSYRRAAYYLKRQKKIAEQAHMATLLDIALAGDLSTAKNKQGKEVIQLSVAPYLRTKPKAAEALGLKPESEGDFETQLVESYAKKAKETDYQRRLDATHAKSKKPAEDFLGGQIVVEEEPQPLWESPDSFMWKRDDEGNLVSAPPTKEWKALNEDPGEDILLSAVDK